MEAKIARLGFAPRRPARRTGTFLLRHAGGKTVKGGGKLRTCSSYPLEYDLSSKESRRAYPVNFPKS